MSQVFTHKKHEGMNNTDRINNKKGTDLSHLLGNQTLISIMHSPSDPAPIQRTYIGSSDNDKLGMLEESRRLASSSDTLLRGAGTIDSARKEEFNTYHHIIPMNLLTKFWNKLIGFKKEDSVQDMMGKILDNSEENMRQATGTGTRDALKHVGEGSVSASASASAPPSSASDAFVSGTNTFADLKANVKYIGKANTVGENRGENPSQAMDDIAAFYQWLPGNLVLGPPVTKRPYDGKESFDFEAAYIREYFNDECIDYYTLYEFLDQFTKLGTYDAELDSRIRIDLTYLSSLPVFIPPAGIWMFTEEKTWHAKDYPNKGFIDART